MALPRILAGPILRRVEPASVAVWVALRDAAEVKLDVYAGSVDAGATSGSLGAIAAAPEASATAETLRVGANLHVAVVAAAPQIPLAPSTLHSYNVTIDGAADLRSEGLLRDDGAFQKALGYAEGLLPSFATAPSKLDDLVLLHSSCQKPHGDGAPTQPQLDALIGKDRDDPLKRPHLMCLTGDQIYADDVPLCLLPGLTELGAELLGVAERLPEPTGAGAQHEASAASLPAGRRQKLSALAGLSSREANCHLLSFGEFCAMYVIAFAPGAWRPLAKAAVPGPAGDDELLGELSADAAAAEAGAAEVLGEAAAGPFEAALSTLDDERLTELREEFLAQKRNLRGETPVAKSSLRADAARFRRALANVPTYMQFDDHEISDDWYITGAWKERVRANPLGRAIVRNGLAAYILFQAWGNDPAAWAGAGRRQLLDRIGDLFPAGAAGPDDGVAGAIDAQLGLGPGGEAEFDFSFAVDGPAHRLLAFDTRTQREYRTAAAAPTLLSAEALDSQLPPGPLPAGLEALIAVSPAPVLGPPLFEQFGMPALASYAELARALRSKEERIAEIAETGFADGRVTGVERWDLEGWSGDPVGFERLLDRLATHPRVLLLSGDVHYGAGMAMRYARLSGQQRTSRIVQFTSSPSRHAWPHHVPELVSHHAWVRVLEQLGLPERRLGWEATIPEVIEGNLAGEPLHYRGRLNRSPVLLSDEGWRHEHDLARPPDWVWELELLTDPRAASERPEAARPAPLTGADLPPFPAAEDPVADLVHAVPGRLDYGSLAQAHQGALGLALARGLQFLNHVARVEFGRNGAGLEVAQELISLRDHPEPEEKPAGYVLHRAALEPLDPLIPAKVGTR